MRRVLRVVQVFDIQEDFSSLKGELREKGYFDYSLTRLVWDFTRFTSVFLLSTALADLGLTFFAIIALTLLTIDIAWWIRDVNNGAVFKSKSASFWVSEVLGIFFLGVAQDRDTNFLKLASDQETSEKNAVSQVKSVVFRIFDYSGVGPCFQKKQFFILALLAWRWVFFAALFSHHLSMIWLAPAVTGLVLAAATRINRAHIRLTKFHSQSHAGNVFEQTLSIREKHRLLTWLSGSLNYHIEHHLFPEMPSRNYPKIASKVRLFAKYHGLPYRETALSELLSR